MIALPSASASAASVAETESKQTNEGEVEQSHLMKGAELKFLYTLDKTDSLKAQLLELVTKKDMAPFYSTLVSTFGWEEDTTFLSTLKSKNELELVKLADKLADAEKNLGEMEVRDALIAKADYLAAIGDKTSALAAYDTALAKTVGAGPRIDVVFGALRVALFTSDAPLLKAKLDDAKKLIDEGGDWDRRNRLKVYHALYCLQVRDVKAAAPLLLDCVATFTATELFSYGTFVLYAVLAAMVVVDRATLRDKVVKSPEIYGSIQEVPHLSTLLHSLYSCKYADFFPALTAVIDLAARDRFLSAHTAWLLRELRLVAYSQYLLSYRSVTLASMARAFGISCALLDTDLAQFIYAGRLSCKIDKVGGVISTTRPAARSAQYAAVVKDGDALLVRIQKLSRVITY